MTILCDLHALTWANVLCCTLPSNFSSSARARSKHGAELTTGDELEQAGDELPQAGAGRHDQSGVLQMKGWLQAQRCV